MKNILGAIGRAMKKIFLVIEYIACLALGCIITVFMEDFLYNYGGYGADSSQTALLIISVLFGNVIFTLIKCDIKKYF